MTIIENHSNQSQVTLASFYDDDKEKFRNPPWWNRRTRMERVLCAVAAIAIVMCISMTLALAFIGYQYRKNIENSLNKPSTDELVIGYDATVVNGKGKNICLTSSCVQTASYFLKNLNQKVNPCDDFYEFACGGWSKTQTIPDDKTSVSVFSILQDELNIKLRGLVENSSNVNEPEYLKSIRYMYKTCMNLERIDSEGNKPLQDILKSFGGWPVVEGDKWNGDNFDWLEILIKFRQYGFNHDILMDLSVTPDFRNNIRHVIDIDQVSLGMPDRAYLLRGLNDTAVAAYFNLMIQSAVQLGADKEFAIKDLTESLKFETVLANFSLPREERRNISLLYNKMTLDDLKDLAPNINWPKYLEGLLEQKLDETDLIIVNVPSFIKKLDRELITVNKRALANYMLWRVVLQSVATLSKNWRNIAQNYNKAITGQDREEPRWEQCLSALTSSLGIGISALYVRNYFPKESKNMALDMVHYIQSEFKNMLEEIEWMDRETKDKALIKAKKIATHIGYPDQLLDDNEIEKLYEKLKLTEDSYFTNVRKLRKWAIDYAFSQLREPNLKGDWRKHARAAIVNAFYNALENSIEFPAGILQGVFYSKDRPNYLNFGSIGFVIGHEITHGFDDRGRQFDGDGNNLNWWDHVTDTRFKNRTQCIIEQYSNFTVTSINLKVNGINTQGENIADNGGLKEAFKGYQKWLKDHIEEAWLPGLPYSPDQLFWISAANVWCSKMRPEALKLRILSGSHSPPQFRVIGPLSNLEDFSNSFKCPKGSNMNPIHKCSVW